MALPVCKTLWALKCNRGVIGTTGRNAFRGPGFIGGDMSIRKNFALTERFKLQIGLNAYNWFNHANYGNNFGGTVGLPSFGHPLGFINPTSSTLPRAFTGEFGARFTFCPPSITNLKGRRKPALLFC